MAFKSRREYVFNYTVKDANPNGDPLNDNHPRYDEETGQVLVSDVRIKRTVRDYWQSIKKTIFVTGEAKSINDVYKDLKEKLGGKDVKEVIGKCIDARLFGVTFAAREKGKKVAFSWTGPVQVKWGRSIHSAKPEFIQGTAAFMSREEAGQRSFRNEYKVPFALISVYAIANQYASENTGATDEDLDEFFNALWNGTNNLITRSKNEHKSRFLLEIKFKEGFDGKIGALDEKIRVVSPDGNELSREEQEKIRSLKDVKVDLSELVESISKFKDSIDSMRAWVDSEYKDSAVGFEDLEELGVKVEIK